MAFVVPNIVKILRSTNTCQSQLKAKCQSVAKWHFTI